MTPMMTRTTVVLKSEDGGEERIDFGPVAVEDPSIAERLESRGDPQYREIVTTFRRASHRPPSYPTDLPFIPGMRTHMNEYPGSDRGPRARWVAFGRTGRLYDEVQRQSLETGWEQDPSIRLAGFADASRVVFLRRGERVRRISEHRRGWLWTRVELEDVPARYLQGANGD
jgi:hypothetical protein